MKKLIKEHPDYIGNKEGEETTDTIKIVIHRDMNEKET